MARGYLGNVWSALRGGTPKSVSPFREAGTGGTAVFGGYVENIERNPRLSGAERYRTAGDILANVSIVAASIRFFLNLVAKPNWVVEPAEDLGEGESSDAAKAAAEFAESLLYDMETSWVRIVRRSGMYRFHGFGIQEWTAKRRKDGLIGMADIEPRPQHTIARWEIDDDGAILGMWQNSPQTGEELWLPRSKVVYLVDDTLTDSPEGMGLFRHLADPADRIQRYLKLEGLGYERDLRGIPIGRAPLSEINAAVEAGQITKEDGEKMLEALRRFVKMQVKSEDTGLIVDSKTYESTTADGLTASAVPKWAMDLLTAQGSGFADLGAAITRLSHDMARIMGTESLLLGGGPSGSRSLSEDKSRNLYLNVNSALGDIAEGFERDFLGSMWRLNGLRDELKPTMKTEDVAFRDVQEIAATLRDMATAGAVLQPDDPAIDDVRDLLGVSRQPEFNPELAAMNAMPGIPGMPGTPLPPTPPGPGAGKETEDADR